MTKINDFLYFYKKKIKGCFLFVGFSVLILLGIYFYNVLTTKAEKIEDSDIEINYLDNTSFPINQQTTYKVDIKGAIKKPGVYEIDSESRIIDVIKQAGGLKDNADTSVINLSKKISDEMVIIIYTSSQVNKFTTVKKEEKIKIESCSNYNNLTNDGCIESNSNTTTASKISINKATIEELMSLSGIGEAKAKLIIEYRKQNGAFTKIEDIMNVTGIGQSLFDKIKNNITI